MRVGIGLPAAVPGTDMTALGRWAARSEQVGFASVGVIDRLVYSNLEPLTALAAAAACTEHVELTTTVLSVGWRNNPVLLAKQLASVELLSGGRLTAGLGFGGWPEDFAVSGVPQSGSAGLWESTLATLRQVWSGTVSGQGGPMPALREGRPALLLGGLVPSAYDRVARHAQGWVAPLFGLSTLEEGTAAVQRAWAQARRSGRPRIATGRYFSLGADADAVADESIRHYYGDEFFAAARADTLTSGAQLRTELEALRAAGATDLVLFPSSGGLEQVDLLAEALDEAGWLSARTDAELG
jgi:alkanesulfonate monooxygenase SsuD/methylene tetrahydromethanopterin reductase-like flavin-dependent oxidoreductase (luciferase family)